jgi:uncharacterized protein (TIGR00369 family)
MEMKILPHTHSCFVCGESNPVGLRLLFHTDGTIVQTKFKPTRNHIGFKGVVHGGITTTLLDEIMVWVCAVRTKKFAYCAELNVRFLGPIQPDMEYAAIAELVADRRRLFEAKAELRNEAGQALAIATGKYIPVPNTDLTEMATDFVDDPSWVMDPNRKE